jgi:Tol biopolymer transport system component
VLVAALLAGLPAVGPGAEPPASAPPPIVLERRAGVALMDAADGTVRLLAPNGTNPVCGAAGDRILHLAWSGGHDVVSIDRQGGGVTRIVRGLDVLPPLSLAPRGERVAFVSQKDRQVYAVGVDGAGLARLTSDPGRRAFRPAWSPDGERMAFHGTPPEGNGPPGLFLLELATGSVRPLTAPTLAVHGHAWSPDGRTLAVAGPDRLRLFDVADGTARTIVQGHQSLRRVSWSPAGDRLAFESSQDGCLGGRRGAVYTVKADGSGLTRINPGLPCRLYSDPQWSPGGETLMFLAGFPRGDMELVPFVRYVWPNVTLADADGTHLRNLTRDPATEDRSPHWCPIRH